MSKKVYCDAFNITRTKRGVKIQFSDVAPYVMKPIFTATVKTKDFAEFLLSIFPDKEYSSTFRNRTKLTCINKKSSYSISYDDGDTVYLVSPMRKYIFKVFYLNTLPQFFNMNENEKTIQAE